MRNHDVDNICSPASPFPLSCIVPSDYYDSFRVLLGVHHVQRRLKDGD